MIHAKYAHTVLPSLSAQFCWAILPEAGFLHLQLTGNLCFTHLLGKNCHYFGIKALAVIFDNRSSLSRDP